MNETTKRTKDKSKPAAQSTAKRSAAKRVSAGTKRAAKPQIDPASVPSFTAEQRHHMIAEAAYLRAERRGFASDPFVDWLEAEREIDAHIGAAATSGPRPEASLA